MSKYIQILSKYALFTIAAEKKRAHKGPHQFFSLFMSKYYIVSRQKKEAHKGP